jgi:hypothetical protein
MVLAVIPSLPILPGGIVVWVVVRRPGSLFWPPGRGVVWRIGVGVAYPSCAPQVVCPTLGVVGQDGVCGDEQAVALEAHGGGQVGDGRRGMAAVRVVQLCESVEAVFRVGVASPDGEDLVGCGSPAGMDGVGPREVGMVAMRLRRRLRVRTGAGVRVGGPVSARGMLGVGAGLGGRGGRGGLVRERRTAA